jgi:hypothetical protein
MAQTHIHVGSCETITPDASPGLLFLSQLLPALDSLEPDTTLLLGLLTPDCVFVINSRPPAPAEHVMGMLAMRGNMLSKFGHDVHTAWDVLNDDGSRTVLFESTSVSVFNGDPEKVEAKVKEFSILELVSTEGKESGAPWKARELRTYMDQTPVSERAKIAMNKIA